MYYWLVLLLLCGVARQARRRSRAWSIVSVATARPPSFLLGTMHSEDQRVTGLLEQFVPLIGRVDLVAVEMVPDAVTMLAIGAATLLPPDQSLRGLIGDAPVRGAGRGGRRPGPAREVLDRLKPWAAAMTLGMPRPRDRPFSRYGDLPAGTGASAAGYGSGNRRRAAGGVRRYAIEAQLTLLDEMVKNAASMPKQLEELTLAYLQGDLGRLDQVARSQYADHAACSRAMVRSGTAREAQSAHAVAGWGRCWTRQDA